MKTHSGWVYVAFVIDVYPFMVVGWQASKSLRSDLAIDAPEMAIWQRQRRGHDSPGWSTTATEASKATSTGRHNA